MVKWSNIAFPKFLGGLGFTETRAMNTSLLAKWILKLESNDAGGGGLSFFWQGLHKVKPWVYRGVSWIRVEETFRGGRGGDLRALDISSAGGCKAFQKFKVRDWLK
uniref:Reverse transcriptase zinc-binding domain-containing protein n=1 Tax=Oryza brachyantha TaxID=4533 RepID=J3N0I7_ORYBR